jgi:hypothetical protein
MLVIIQIRLWLHIILLNLFIDCPNIGLLNSFVLVAYKFEEQVQQNTSFVWY